MEYLRYTLKINLQIKEKDKPIIKRIKMYMRIICLLFFICLSCTTNAQIFDVNSAQMVLDARSSYIQAYGQMTQRAIQIMQAVQPYREAMYQKARNGEYEDAIRILDEVDKKYIYYVFDNRGIRDMLSLGGDCACNLGAYELAILLYQKAKEAEENGMDSKLYHVFDVVMNNARQSYRANDYSTLWNNVTTALKTGWENGECYYYYGVCYERGNNLRDAKKMYKIAKKKKYEPAVEALKNLKKKK